MILYLFEHMRSIITLRNFGNCAISATAQLLAFLGNTLDFAQLSQLFNRFVYRELWGVAKLRELPNCDF
jgi:hypothetical protein